MANTETDEYLNSLIIWSTFEIDWKSYQIKEVDDDNQWVICEDWSFFTWTEIHEDYELMQLADKTDYLVDLQIKKLIDEK